MKAKKSNLSARRLAFYISFTYVLLATIHSFWAMETLATDSILSFWFLPASFLLSLILFTERIPIIKILVVQSITLGIIYFFVLGVIITIQK